MRINQSIQVLSSSQYRDAPLQDTVLHFLAAATRSQPEPRHLTDFFVLQKLIIFHISTYFSRQKPSGSTAGIFVSFLNINLGSLSSLLLHGKIISKIQVVDSQKEK